MENALPPFELSILENHRNSPICGVLNWIDSGITITDKRGGRDAIEFARNTITDGRVVVEFVQLGNWLGTRAYYKHNPSVVEPGSIPAYSVPVLIDGLQKLIDSYRKAHPEQMH